MRRSHFAFLLPVATLCVSSLVAPPVRATPVTDRLTFEQPSGGVAAVEAEYPNPPGETCPTKIAKTLRARYRGTLEVAQTSDGRLAIVDRVTFSQYLSGLSEVPRSWPAETLKAQVIAARSYALYQIAHPRASWRDIGYDICSTDQCQVFRGVGIEQGAFGEKWVAAVRATEGLALVHDGAPITAFYFSTSSGRTRSNADVFGGAALPYLKPVAGADDDAPLAHWTARIPLADFAAILWRAGIWPGGPIPGDRVARDGDTVTIGTGSGAVRPSVSSMRNALNKEAPCAFPDRYPPRTSSGSKLPQTLPSTKFTVRVAAGDVIFEGRGWGHDVGMSQYGAKALADRGREAADILAYYYGGLRPQKVTEPGEIRVLVAEGAIRVRITPENGGTLRTGNGGAIGSGEAYEITPAPAGKPSPARVTRVAGATATPALRVESAGAPALEAFASLRQTIRLSSAARLTTIVTREDAEIARGEEVSLEGGEHALVVALATANGAALPDGAYSVVFEAYDGLDRVRLVTPVEIRRPVARASEEPILWWRPLAVLAAAAAFGVFAMLMLMRRRGAR